MALALRRSESGVRAVLPWLQVQQRRGIARLGLEEGRWSPMIVDMALALAPKASSAIDANLWVELLDELSAEIERGILGCVRSSLMRRAKPVGRERAIRK